PPAFPASGRAVSPGESAGPIRLDYFGDEIESIRRVDTDTMGSQQPLEQVQILGASAKQLQSDDQTTSLLSLLPPDTLVVIHEVLELAEQARGYFERLTNPRGIYPPKEVFKALTARPHVEVNQYSAGAGTEAPTPVPVRPLPSFDKDAGKAIGELIEISGKGEGRVTVLCAKEAERDRLMELVAEHHGAAGLKAIDVEVGYLHRGFIWEGDHPGVAREAKPVHLVPHHELFHRYHTRRRIRRILNSSAGAKASDAFLDMVPGDYVVHVDHGIARFNGLKSMKKEGRAEEYLTLEFDQKALLHVPAAQIDLVQKYVGGFHGKPPLSSLGGKRWAKQKEQVAEAVKDMAAEMLRIHAARASMPGIRYPGDTPWQKEFEAEFPYDETQDQLAAIAEVKKDMAHEQPMDRLICGDVGFGKTEIAIRAAFKAAEYGKQVAVLVPTTVLAEQHERTFRDRMADYPFRVESISRFKTAGEARKVLEELAQGRVDIIIGTHRLLSADVHFPDLGLVIIDEEQRFGVEHKQKLLQLRLTVDVLTLSATPIPRTLHMSMLGLRDISSLTTPPMDRRAIVTETIAEEKGRIRDAILRELNRQGQVYFVHNRVYDIQSVADDLQRLVPEAKIVIGHGQMPGHELEEVMLKFIRHEADILVSTTIIESGLDIPTANTMFIHDADHFGLADLHQLRGRVGRYKHRAYCYLILPNDRPVTDTAAHRLRAIEQYAMLGAGFKIAMRDLELRGAGNLLGAEQSGHIAAVGYELYCELLEQATRRLKHETWVEPARTHLELPVSGQIPKSYIGSEKHRMEAYRRIGRAATPEEFDAVVHDLNDAYGQPPPAAQAFIDLAEIRIAAGALGVEKLKLEGPDLIFRTDQPARLDAVLRDAPGRASVIDDKTVYYRPPPSYLEPATLMAVLRKLLVRKVRKPAEPPAATAGKRG
ncbi:MAG: transcription-repair coupling factor, partial [Planctomycetota bacterium]|nr:transcription-repair coupling factor [Planctomycetota bacterium]